MAFTGPFDRKLVFAGQLFIKDSFIQLNENPRNGSVVDGTSAGRTDGMSGTMMNE
jgi:hypothetical protein